MTDTATEVYKGKQNSITVRFVRNGAPVSFQSAPRWNLLNDNGDTIQTGTAQSGSNGEWTAVFTIPTDYEPLGGTPDEDMILEVFGTDTNRKERSTERELHMIDFADDYLPEGVVWFKGQPLTDVLVTSKPITTLSATIQNGAGEGVLTIPSVTRGTARQVRNTSDVPDRFDVGSKAITTWQTEVTLSGAFDLPESTVPYLIYYTITTADGVEQVVHQLFWTNNRVINLMMRLRSYLDKARLTEIDPNMQWSDNELVAATYEGLQYVNGYEPMTTYWRQSDLPMPLDSYWMYASAHYLLNTRYLAEGMTKFNFTGLNTTLDNDRTEALVYKIDELTTRLQMLTNAKKSAITSEGKGMADPTATSTVGSRSIGLLGLSINPTNNRVSTRSQARMRRFTGL